MDGQELETLYNEPKIIAYKKSQIIRQLRHIERLEIARTPIAKRRKDLERYGRKGRLTKDRIL